MKWKTVPATTLTVNTTLAGATGSPNSDARQKFWVATIGHFVTDFYNGFLAPLLPIIVIRLNLTLTLAGLLLSIFSISNSLLQPLAGAFSDRMRRNYFLIFGPIITALFLGFIGWVNQYWTLVLILVGSGFGTAAFHPQSAALVGGLTYRSKGFTMSVYNMAGALGVAVGSVVIIPLTNSLGLKASVLTILPALLLFLYSASFFSRTASVAKEQRKKTNLAAAVKSNWYTITLLHSLVVFRAILILSFSGFMPLYMTSKGETPFFGGLTLAVFQFFATAGILAGGRLYDRFGARKTLFLSFIFILPLGIACLHVPAIWSLPILGLMGFLLTFATSVNILLGQQIMPENAGFISALMMGSAWGLAGLLMTPVGALADRWGLQTTLSAISVVALFGVLMVAIIPFHRFKSAPVTQ
ncbi:MAG: MFS transporter [Candidatus Zhuqueibacterota bacterium]